MISGSSLMLMRQVTRQFSVHGVGGCIEIVTKIIFLIKSWLLLYFKKTHSYCHLLEQYF